MAVEAERHHPTREVIGYAMADHHRAELVVDAPRMAAARGGLKEGCITYSDRGSECTSREYRSLIQELGLRQSMGRTGSCYDNAATESFSVCWKRRSAPRSGSPTKPPEPTSSVSSRSSTTAPACASTLSTATSPHSRPELWRRKTSR
ncbi:DDE-type integrase/transposase/recombinase [Streptomyces sp. NPDC057580]|uniref:DDE-type integrase/transposase/recombinase n=1 Tax=Streptomyces sp. NPDC057580 TaxID=3346173 RepID=UPI0036A74A59